MTFSDILTIIGLAVSVIFGIWGIMVAVNKKYPGRLTFVEENALGLFNSMVKNFSEIKIEYEGQPISEQMVYLKSSFINTGSIDLSTNTLTQKLKIGLSDDYKWIKCKLTGHSKDINCSIKNENNELVIDFDLLRKNEYIQFEAFAEIKNTTKPASTFRKALIFSHRIPNTAKINKQSYLSEEQINDKKFEFKKNLVFATLFLVVIIGFTTYNYTNKISNIEYKYTPKNIEYTVKVNALGKEFIKLVDDDLDFSETMTVDNFNKLKNFKATITELTFWGHIWKLSFMLLYVVMYSFFMFSEYRAIFKDKKIKNILDNK